jgi:large subunit ribosomal protein L9
MKVILKEDVKNIGSMGQTIDVADGFGRNYLVPKGLAVEANIRNVKSLEHEKKVIQEKAKKIKTLAQDLASKISNTSVVLKVKAGEEGKLFGSVTTMDIAEQLKNEGIEIDKKKILIEEAIKRLGSYTVKVRIYPEVIAELNIQVVEE